MTALNPKSVNLLVVHHTAGNKSDTVAQIRAQHLAKGWSDIGYHWLIDDKGKIHKGRPEDEQGAHAYGINERSLGVCVIGDYSRSKPSDAALSSLVFVLADLCRRFRLKRENIIGHRDAVRFTKTATPTECPGDTFYTLMPEIRRRVEQTLTPPPTPKASDEVRVFVNGQQVGTGRIIEGKTFVPVAAIAQALGCSVEWDGDAMAVKIKK